MESRETKFSVREARAALGLSQAKLAKLLKVNQAYLSAIELGKVELPDKLEQEIKTLLASLSAEDVQKLKQKKIRHRRIGRPSGKSGELSYLPNAPLISSPQKYTAISLFSGCGGLCLGFVEAGFKILGYVERDESLRRIYELNFPDTACLGDDVTKISDQEVLGWAMPDRGLDVLFGGPPCQGFSLAGKRDVYDPRNQLFNYMANIAKLLKPKYVVLENVRLLTSMKAPDGSFIKDHIIRVLDEAGYNTDFRELNAQDFGVPQSRERVFFVGVRKDLPLLSPRFPSPRYTDSRNIATLFSQQLKPYRTFKDATGDLPNVGPGETCPTDPLHFGVGHPPHVIEWLKHTPEGCSAHDNENPEHRPPSGYNTTYKRIRWNEPSSTIQTTFGMISACRTVHPTQHRSLTIREAMRCQTFPDTFKVVGSIGTIRTAIGNAVPPKLGQAIAAHIVQIGLSQMDLAKDQLVGNL